VCAAGVIDSFTKLAEHLVACNYEQEVTNSITNLYSFNSIKIYSDRKLLFMLVLINKKERERCATLINRRLSPVLTSDGYGQ
jgi:hypothetical protein